jgi:hypothetical protein
MRRALIALALAAALQGCEAIISAQLLCYPQDLLACAADHGPGHPPAPTARRRDR